MSNRKLNRMGADGQRVRVQRGQVCATNVQDLGFPLSKIDPFCEIFTHNIVRIALRDGVIKYSGCDKACVIRPGTSLTRRG